MFSHFSSTSLIIIIHPSISFVLLQKEIIDTFTHNRNIFLLLLNSIYSLFMEDVFLIPHRKNNAHDESVFFQQFFWFNAPSARAKSLLSFNKTSAGRITSILPGLCHKTVSLCHVPSLWSFSLSFLTLFCSPCVYVGCFTSFLCLVFPLLWLSALCYLMPLICSLEFSLVCLLPHFFCPGVFWLGFTVSIRSLKPVNFTINYRHRTAPTFRGVICIWVMKPFIHNTQHHRGNL